MSNDFNLGFQCCVSKYGDVQFLYNFISDKGNQVSKILTGKFVSEAVEEKLKRMEKGKHECEE